MKIVYYTSQYKSISIKLNNSTYSLYSEETLDIEHDEQNNVMQINTEKTVEMNVWRTIMFFLTRLILNVFNVIFLNYSENWFDDLDPFVMSATYKIDCQTIMLKYIPARISKSPMFIQKPKLIINNKLIDAKFEFDVNSVKKGFVKCCFDIVSFWLYSSIPITLIFVYSGKFSSLIGLYVLILVVITLPVIFIIRRTYKEKQRLLKFWIQDKK